MSKDEIVYIEVEETPEHEEAANELVALIALALYEVIGADPYDLPVHENTREVFNNDLEKICTAFLSVHDYYKIEPDYELLTEFEEFETVEVFYQYMLARVYHIKGLLPDDIFDYD